MKALRFIVVALLSILALTSCASPQGVQIPSASPVSSTPSPVTAAETFTEPTRYETREEFHNAVIDAKASQNIGDSQTTNNVSTPDKLEEIVWYFDFANPVEEVELGEIGVRKTYVALEYWNIEEDSPSIVIQTFRWENLLETRNETETEYLDMLKSNSGAREVSISGKRVLKKEIYRDGFHTHNNYDWLENGYRVFLRAPSWLLDLYPEETFFDIEVVNVSEETMNIGVIGIIGWRTDTLWR